MNAPSMRSDERARDLHSPDCAIALEQVAALGVISVGAFDPGRRAVRVQSARKEPWHDDIRAVLRRTSSV
jgi:hypothetical protein